MKVNKYAMQASTIQLRLQLHCKNLNACSRELQFMYRSLVGVLDDVVVRG